VNTFVVDASVAAKWFLPSVNETLVDEAVQLLTDYAEDKVRFIVPDIFWAEFGNILWKAVRQGRWLRNTAESAVSSLREQRLPTTPSKDLLTEALNIALTFDRTVYDSLYVALAWTRGSELITADERLANALAAHMPVKWLGAR
jgi:predicted nucleic acid-binding protein